MKDTPYVHHRNLTNTKLFTLDYSAHIENAHNADENQTINKCSQENNSILL